MHIESELKGAIDWGPLPLGVLSWGAIVRGADVRGGRMSGYRGLYAHLTVHIYVTFRATCTAKKIYKVLLVK